ncbi:[Pyruvate dehydrogenase (acetyl-transferring)] kinase, mitochondrial [Smittium mucronatum]|uniref:Protein-serine/threonine kinase n=1 Tax=Smittium mucronatum TaxID=133383 RepID=A0A1R0H879_9FUNG|nr:[Pyruvate dehydrogenase (acetyl-transferring)] kinase, mitochondrial [Smittium mucronatum]
MTRVSLSQLYTLGRHLLKNREGSDYKVFEIPTKFLYKELPIRFSQCIKGLHMGITPYAVHKLPTFRKFMMNLNNDFEKIVNLTPPQSEATDKAFMEALRKIGSYHYSNLSTINQGLRELSQAIDNNDPDIVPSYLLPQGKPNMLSASSPAIQDTGSLKWLDNQKSFELFDIKPSNVATFMNNNPTFQYAEARTQKFFDWFYSMCLGSQLLIQDHLSIRDLSKSYVQKISPLNIVHNAVNDARRIAAKHYGIEPPEVTVVSPNPNISTVYIPELLYCIVFELLKNSLRATIEFNQSGNQPISRKFPPLKIIVAEGVEDLTFKVSDEGGGMPASKVAELWSYTHQQSMPYDHASITSPSETADPFKEPDFGSSTDYPMFGFGVGLPTARLIARYFGGDLDVVSMEGYGSDFYLHLQRSGNVAECTPDLSQLTLQSSSSSVSDLIDSLELD